MFFISKCNDTKVNVMIPSSVMAIDAGAFSECKSLISVNIPDSVIKILVRGLFPNVFL